MVDTVGIAMGWLTGDTELMKLLNNNSNAVHRIKAPDAKIKPRIDVALLDDGDADFYDGEPHTYISDFSIVIWGADSRLYEIAEQVDKVLRANKCERGKHRDGYSLDVDQYFKEMAYRVTFVLEEEEEINGES
jgi:hypothetical protein